MRNLYLQNKSRFNQTAAWLLVIALMVLIFQFSSQVADDSNQLSTGITQYVADFIEKVTNQPVDMKLFNHIIRKGAHFTIYMVLGFLMLNAAISVFRSFGYAVIFSFLSGLLYAISDEVHQFFVPGRGPSITDVGIDSLGLLTGILIFTIITKKKYDKISD